MSQLNSSCAFHGDAAEVLPALVAKQGAAHVGQILAAAVVAAAEECVVGLPGIVREYGMFQNFSALCAALRSWAIESSIRLRSRSRASVAAALERVSGQVQAGICAVAMDVPCDDGRRQYVLTFLCQGLYVAPALVPVSVAGCTVINACLVVCDTMFLPGMASCPRRAS